MSELSPRKQQILRAVVIEYVTYAEPVASDVVAQKYELGVKSATVRNEMAEITDLGLLEQPHTSAGRIPSDTGYRYYVDRLISKQPVEPEVKQRVLSAADEEHATKELVSETTKTLSRLTQLLTAASTIRDTEVLVRNVVITALGPEKALVVVLLQNGLVENRILELPTGVSLDDVGRANEALERLVSNKTLKSILKLRAPATSVSAVDRLLKLAVPSIRAIAQDLTRGQLITAGEEFIFAQPEFRRDPEAMQALVNSLSDESQLLAAVSGGGNPAITIGRENQHAALYPLTVIRQTFFVGDDEAGTLAVIGPTRMNYDGAVPLLEFTAQAISKTLTRLFT